ncbi:MAG: PIN domain-containing protein [Thermoguttaceae bacterium]
MNTPRAILDACVLYQAQLRGLLIYLAISGVFRAYWTDTIHDEWISSLLRNRKDLKREQLEHTRQMIDRHAWDAVIQGYESIIPTLVLPDPDDRHVLAAAIHGEAAYIVTFNVTDFPRPILQPYAIEAIVPDDFLMLLVERDRENVLQSVRQHRVSLRFPEKTPSEYVAWFDNMNLQSFATFLRHNIQFL